MVFAMRSWSASTDSDTESVGKKLMLELKLKVKSRPSEKIKRKAMKVLAMSHLGVDTICFDGKEGTFTLVGHINPVEVVFELRKICVIYLVSVAILTAQNDTFPTTERITELILIKDTDRERKRSLGILISEEQPEQSKKPQEDQPPPQQADSSISQVDASPPSRPLPPLSGPLASEAQPSSSTVSRPSHGKSDQMQAAPHHAPLSSPVFQTESLTAVPAHSSISGGACLPKDMKNMEDEGLEGHDQLYDSAVHHLLSSIDGIGELKRHYDLRAGEQASRLKEADDTAIMLRKQVEELEAKVSEASITERRLMDMICISEDRHDRTKMELALMREKLDEGNHQIEYLEGVISRYQSRIVAAEIEEEKVEERRSRASVEGDSMRALVRALRCLSEPCGSKEYLH
ncbi:hypothetical protein ACJRO7_025343 [Eucalyptus globulus]|uniref:Uncharacterized protein n=1 Tax=Eucalyptus globulus TaxID=34317 RepID=A0ABD3KFA9_EUCGL